MILVLKLTSKNCKEGVRTNLNYFVIISPQLATLIY